MPEIPAQPRPKIIKTGELGLEVPEYAPAYQQVEKIVAQFRAFMADVNTQEGAGGVVTGKVAIRAVPEKFEALFAALKVVGRVESENVQAADVTAQSVAIEARIKAAPINEERLQDLVKGTSIIDKISSLLEVERELARVRGETEQMQGQLCVLGEKVKCPLALVLYESGREAPRGPMTLEVGGLEAAVGRLNELVSAHNGSVVSHHTSRREDGSLAAELKLAVPARSAGWAGRLVHGRPGCDRHHRRVRQREAGPCAGTAAGGRLDPEGADRRSGRFVPVSGPDRLRADGHRPVGHPHGAGDMGAEAVASSSVPKKAGPRRLRQR